MEKFLSFILSMVLSGLVLLFSLMQGCSVTVRCPAGPMPATYYYDLQGEDMLKTIRVVYDPENSRSGEATITGIRPGSYRLLENGEERCSFTLAPGTRRLYIRPRGDWPVLPRIGGM